MTALTIKQIPTDLISHISTFLSVKDFSMFMTATRLENDKLARSFNVRGIALLMQEIDKIVENVNDEYDEAQTLSDCEYVTNRGEDKIFKVVCNIRLLSNQIKCETSIKNVVDKIADINSRTNMYILHVSDEF